VRSARTVSQVRMVLLGLKVFAVTRVLVVMRVQSVHQVFRVKLVRRELLDLMGKRALVGNPVCPVNKAREANQVNRGFQGKKVHRVCRA
jgi:hypothetical protein